jgi:pimeloyl-ACP methyl ester carboxylesterase
MAHKERNYVLVHGGFHGGWCWARVAKLLRAEGHNVYAPSLTGLGDRAHLANASVNCSTHIQDIVNIIQYEQLNDVVLVGHSYGGFIIGGVADRIPEKIGTIVYLDAIVPTDGMTMLDIMSPDDILATLKAVLPRSVSMRRMWPWCSPC